MGAVMVADQRLAALERANDVRSARKVLKGDVKAGRVSLPDVLRDPPDMALGMPVWELLMSVRFVAEAKASWLLGSIGVRSPRKRLGDLTVRQRWALAYAVETKAWLV